MKDSKLSNLLLNKIVKLRGVGFLAKQVTMTKIWQKENRKKEDSFPMLLQSNKVMIY